MSRQGAGFGTSARFGLYGPGVGAVHSPYGRPMPALAPQTRPVGPIYDVATFLQCKEAVGRARAALGYLKDMRVLLDNPWSADAIGWQQLVAEGALISDMIDRADVEFERGPKALPPGFDDRVARFVQEVRELDARIRPRAHL